MKSGRVNFCPGKLFLKLLAEIGEWHQNLSEKTVSRGSPIQLVVNKFEQVDIGHTGSSPVHR